MNNLLELVKVDLRETLDVRKFKENKSKSISFFAFLGLMLILGLVLSIIYNLMFSSLFLVQEANLVYSTLFMGGFATFLTLSTSIFKVKSIYVGKDYEMLKSMPVKKTEIIAAKIINLYLIELIYSAIIMIPNAVINIIFTGNFTFIITGLLATLLIPAIPMAVACLFSLFITLVADRYKFGNVINFILYFLMFAAIMFFSLMINMSTGAAGGQSDMVDMANAFAWVNPSLQLVKLAHLDNYLYILLFALGNVVVLFLVILFISLFFDGIHEMINSYKSNNVYVKKKLETKGQFKALLGHEYKRFFTSKFYFVNCISSGICSIIMSALIGYMFSPISTITDAASIMVYIRQYAYLGVIIIAFGIGIATPASGSISIEGTKFWMIKTFPIDYKKMIKSKLLVSISVLGVCALISSGILVALTQPSIYSIIILFVAPLLFVTLASVLGLLINISYYKLKWKNEQQFCKNSASVVISMLLDWLIMIILAGLLVGFTFVNIYLAGILTIAALAIATIILYIVLMKTCERKIEAIEEF